jgi:hypothetical protein
VLLATAAAWLWLRAPGTLWPALAVALLFADLTYQGHDAFLSGPWQPPWTWLEGLSRAVPPAPEPRRVGAIDFYKANHPAALGWEGATGYNPSHLRAVDELLDLSRTGELPAPGPLDRDTNFAPYAPKAEVTKLLSIDDTASWTEGRGRRVLGGYRQPHLPRAYWVSAYEVPARAEKAAALRIAARGDRAVLEQALATPSGPPQGPVAAASVEVRPNSERIVIDAPADGLVVIADPYFPGWTARVDGQPAPLLRANHALQAVQVGKGRHTIELRYFPRRLLPGLLGALLAAAALLGMLLLRRRSRAVNPAAA